MRHTAHNFLLVDDPHIIRFSGNGRVVAVGEDYITISTPASGMPTNREANAVYNATVKPSVSFARTSRPSKGEQIAAGVAENTVDREPIAGGEIGKSGNIQKHREVYRENTWNGLRESADESRMSGEVIVRGIPAFSTETANHARTVADEVRYFFQQTQGDNQMKTKLDTMNHAQRAMFARKMLGKIALKHNSATSVNSYAVTKEAK